MFYGNRVQKPIACSSYFKGVFKIFGEELVGKDDLGV